MLAHKDHADFYRFLEILGKKTPLREHRGLLAQDVAYWHALVTISSFKDGYTLSGIKAFCDMVPTVSPIRLLHLVQAKLHDDIAGT